MNDEGLEFIEPNAGAFTREERRTGPPLGYVAEKLRCSLEALHEHLLALDGDAHARLAFHYGLVAYLALNNLLAVANETGLATRLAHGSHDDLQRFLDGVDREGSVT